MTDTKGSLPRRVWVIHFVGAGPGAPDLITLRGAELLREADVLIYAGSLVHPALVKMTKPACACYNSAYMTLEEIITVMEEAERRREHIVRLHSGDPCLYGAIREQMDALDRRAIPYDCTPGVSSFCGAAAALKTEYTLPEVSQSVILTRLAGCTPVPERLRDLAAHGTSMAIFLSAGMLEDVQRELLAGGGYEPDTPVALVHKATWPEERVIRCTVGTLARAGEGMERTTLILVGAFLDADGGRSYLYGQDRRNGQTPSKTHETHES